MPLPAGFLLTVGGNNASTTYSGNISGGSASFTKTGAGTLTLNGTQSYTGATTVNAGKLYVNGPLSASSTVSVSSGATFGGGGSAGAVTVASSGAVEGGQSGVGSLTLNGDLTFNGAGALNVANLAGGASIVNVNGNLSANGSPGSLLINIGGTAPAITGDYKLVGFTGALSSSSAFVLGSLPTFSSRATNGGLSFATPNEIDWIISGDFPIWTGANNGLWSGGNNWQLFNAGTPTDFLPGDAVLFSDSATTTAVSISGSNVAPTSVTFNNSVLNYTLSGSKGIVGAATLTKSGGASLLISNSNAYTGGTIVAGGLLQLGAQSAIPDNTAITVSGGTLDLGGFTKTTSAAVSFAGGTVQNGTFVSSAGYSATSGFVSASLRGSAALNKSGAGTLILANSNTYAGGTTINNGTLQANAAGALGSGTVSVNPGGILQIGANSPGGGLITISGGVPNAGGGGQVDLNGSTISNNLFITFATTGQGAVGALVNSSSTTAVINGNVLIGGNNYTGGSGNITINGVISGGVSAGNNYAFYQQGTGVWKLANSANTFDGYYYIAGGVTQVTALANINQPSSLGQPTIPGTDQLVFNAAGGTLDYIGSAASTTDRTILLNGANEVIAADGASPAATLTITGNASGSPSASLVLSGANTGSNNFEGTISSGALAKNGPGLWILSGTNTFVGGTTVSDGTLILTNSQALADGTRLTVGDASFFPSPVVPGIVSAPRWRRPSRNRRRLALFSAAAVIASEIVSKAETIESTHTLRRKTQCTQVLDCFRKSQLPWRLSLGHASKTPASFTPRRRPRQFGR